MDTENNGHDPVTIMEDENLKELVKQFGEITEVGADSVTIQQRLGVVQRIITAIMDDKEYRQSLYQGAYKNDEEARLVADAITERKRYGVPITPIIDRVTTQCGVKGRRVGEAIGGINSHNIYTNRNGGAPGWKQNQSNKTIT